MCSAVAVNTPKTADNIQRVFQAYFDEYEVMVCPTETETFGEGYFVVISDESPGSMYDAEPTYVYREKAVLAFDEYWDFYPEESFDGGFVSYDVVDTLVMVGVNLE